MSVRYSVAIVPEPAFTARVYQARQIICGQYASWAAEMFPVHLPLVEFFQCQEGAVAWVAARLSRVARGTGRLVLHPYSPPVVGLTGVPGTIALDYNNPNYPWVEQPFNSLRQAVLQVLREMHGVVLDPRSAGEDDRLYIPLMQQAQLRFDVFQGAVTFAQGVVREVLRDGSEPRMWRGGGQLILMRLESAAADAVAGGWEQGCWAADLRWSLVASHQL